MFGFGKNKRVNRISEDISKKLTMITPFQRHMNEGRFPKTLRNNNYVLGYHFMMALNLYLIAVNGKSEPSEQGAVLLRSISAAMEIEPSDLGPWLEGQMSSPDSGFSEGVND